MRRISDIVIHCSATPPEMDVGWKWIRDLHTAPKSKGGRGWADGGYHEVIRRDGTVEHGRNHATIGAHVAGFNKSSLGICMIGGVRRATRNGKDVLIAENNFTPAQFDTLEAMLREFSAKYPGAKISGHRDFDKGKECPSFSVRDFLTARGWERTWV